VDNAAQNVWTLAKLVTETAYECVTALLINDLRVRGEKKKINKWQKLERTKQIPNKAAGSHINFQKGRGSTPWAALGNGYLEGRCCGNGA